MRLLHPTQSPTATTTTAAVPGVAAAAAVAVCFAYIEFYSVDHATYVLQCTAMAQWESQLPHLRVAYARETAMRQLFQAAATAAAATAAAAANGAANGAAVVPPPPPPLVPPTMPQLSAQQQLVAQALQAAQWNLNNGYAASAAPQDPSLAPPSLPATGPATAPTDVSLAPPVVPTVWPPQFETNGGLYVFQAKTGCFLEPRSDFYYDPKAKVYMRGSDAACFQFDMTLDPPFRPCASLPGVSAKVDAAVAPAAVAVASTASTSTTAVAAIDGATAAGPVKLSLNKKPTAPGVAAAAGPKRAQRDIAKWGAIQREMHDDDDEPDAAAAAATASSRQPQQSQPSAPSSSSSALAPTATAVSATVAPPLLAPVAAATAAPTAAAAVATASSAASTTTSAVTSTGSAAASHACLLCQRGFSSAEMLARHEKESKLHAENLAKQQKLQQVPQYRDRAEERRLLFGSDADHLPRVANPVDVDVQNASEVTALPVASTMVLAAAATTTVASSSSSSSTRGGPVDVAADEHNPGNLLLRKFGWTDGQGLGKDNSGRAVAVGVELASAEYAQKTSAMQATLRSTLGTSVAGPTGAAGGGGAALSRTQQNMAAARARFDELDQQPTEKRP